MMCQYICSLSMSDLVMFTFFFFWNGTGMWGFFLYLIKDWKRLEGGGVWRGEGREEVKELASEWVLVFLLRRADIIKDSPCVLPLLSSKGMLAPGSSACYCVALAEKRLRKWLWTAEEEEGARGGHGTGCVSHLPAGRGVHKQFSLLSYTCACKPFSCTASFTIFCSVSHSPFQFNTQYTVYFCHPLNIFLFLTPPVFFLPLLPLFTSSEQPPLFFAFHFFAVPSPCLLCRVFVPWLDLAHALSHFAPSVAARCCGLPSILGRLFVCVAAAITTLAVLRMSPMVCLTDVHPPGTTLRPITV